MFNIIKKEIEWGGQKLTLETGRIARQADASVLATLGETIVLCNVVVSKTPKEDLNFLALTVSYVEKLFAAGRIPGGFHKREGKPSNNEVLISRLIDRALRPLFPKGYHNEIQVTCTVLSFDQINSPDIVALIGASAALSISPIPFAGPLAAVNVGYMDGKIVYNPELSCLEQSDLQLMLAGDKQSILMVESESKELPEEVILEALEGGFKHFQPVISLIQDFKKSCPDHDRSFTKKEYLTEEQKEKVKNLCFNELKKAFQTSGKLERAVIIKESISNLLHNFSDEIHKGELKESYLLEYFGELEKSIVRNKLLTTGTRVDGRVKDEIRNIDCQVSVLPRTHGSALFTRGETQVLAVVTLGGMQDVQISDSLSTNEVKESFYLHYNFPGFSVNEATPLRAPGRREIGHGNLASRALKAVIPSKEEFPYTIRLVADVTESNGSSSMASVCGGSLALMDTGVPLRKPVAGIAMGLVFDSDDYIILSDIMGIEDYLGDMDFKVAGTSDGITALQMDIKVAGINIEIMKAALEQAKKGRLYILDKMNKVLVSHRKEISKNAPQINIMKINKDQIREVIGSGGKNIREICEISGCKIDISEDGTLTIFSANIESYEKARSMIKGSLKAQPVIGEVFEGKVANITDFGIFISLNGFDGLLKTSDLEKLSKSTSDFKPGQEVSVRVTDIDKRGKVRVNLVQEIN